MSSKCQLKYPTGGDTISPLILFDKADRIKQDISVNLPAVMSGTSLPQRFL